MGVIIKLEMIQKLKNLLIFCYNKFKQLLKKFLRLSMNTEIFNRFKENVHHAVGFINILDALFSIAREKIQDFKSQIDQKGGISPIIIPGFESNFRENNEYDLLGIIPQSLQDLEKNINPVMINSCSKSIVVLITIIEVYLRDLVEWIFKKKPNIFSCDKEITLKYKDIIDLNIDNQYLRTKIIERYLNDISKKNLADFILELFDKKFHWKLSKMSTDLESLKDLSAIRNIIVHNNSKVDQIFLQNISTPGKYKLNDELVILPHLFKENAKKAYSFIKKLDELAFSKCK